MNSMKRTCTPRAFANSTKSQISSSLKPRIMTQLIFTESKPALVAIRIPSSTESRLSRRVMRLNFSGTSVSRLILICETPASRSWRAFCCNRTPFVESANVLKPAIPDNEAHSSSTPVRTSGSPPVSLIFRTPRPTNITASRSISSKESKWILGVRGMPSAGMQYRQRRLHRSVIEIRR